MSSHIRVARPLPSMLTAITFGANEGMRAALVVWIGCSLGLFAADMLGMLIGYLLKSKTPDGLLSMLAFAIFSIFGVYTLYQGLKLKIPLQGTKNGKKMRKTAFFPSEYQYFNVNSA